MSVRGGRGSRRLWTAAALTLIFLLPLLPLAPVQAQQPSDPWWGPSDRAKPTEGWAIRVPVVVENKLNYVVSDTFVTAELDFARLLDKAGWPNETKGDTIVLRGFTLDVDSIRVVEYNRGFVTGPLLGSATKPTPHVFYPALLESSKYRAFNASQNPAGTVMWQIQGDLRPAEKRYFYVYANPLEYGDTPPAEFDLLERSPLDAFLWGTQGNVFLAHEPKQDTTTHPIEIMPLSEGTTLVRISTYDSKFQEISPTSTLKSPIQLQGGIPQTIQLPADEQWRLESDKPISVWSLGRPVGGGYEAFGYAPGRSGSFADDEFTFRAVGSVRLTKSSGASVTVTGCDGTIVLTNANPSRNCGIQAPGWKTLVGSGGKFTVSLAPVGTSPTSPFHTHQVPAITGGPSGVDFFSFLANDEGYYWLCPEANATLRVADFDSATSLQLFPEGTTTNTPAARVAKGDMCTRVPVPSSANSASRFEFYSTEEERDPVPGSPVPFRLLAGAGSRAVIENTNLTRPQLSFYGGLAGVDYYVQGDTAIFGHYNGTRVEVLVERIRDGVPYVEKHPTAGSASIQRDGFLAVPGVGTGRMHIVASKPIAVSPLAPAQYTEEVESASGGDAFVNRTIPYVRAIPGRPIMPNTTLGDAQIRGPLVALRSPDATAKDTGPGSPVTFRVDVHNLGRWVNGENLPDTIGISCTTPEGWTVEGCTKEVTLNSGSSDRLNVVVTPSIGDVNKSRPITVEARSKTGGSVATFKLTVLVNVRYGVGMWFDVEGGRKTIDPPIGLDPAGIHRYNVVFKNTGSSADTFAITVDPPREGWEQALLLADEPVSSLTLDGGESVVLQFRVKAPNLESAPQNIVSITAQSASSPLAADVVNTATRIRPKVDLELTLEPQTLLAEPNETVRFNLTTRNKGNDVFTVLFRQDSILPKGWNATLAVDEITLNPNPGNDPALNYVLAVRVTPPEGARAGDLASVKLTAEIDTGGAGGRVAGDEVSAVVVVRRVYNLTPANVFDAEATAGEALDFVLPITNAGNGQVEVELLSGAVTPAWPVTLLRDDITLAVNDTADLPLRIEVPRGTPAGAYNLTFTTRLSREALVNLSIPVNVRAIPRVDFEGDASIALVPGRPTTFLYRAVNTGNVETTFAFEAIAPAGWNATVTPPSARLAVGDDIEVLLELNATRDQPDATLAAELVARPETGAPTGTDLAIDVRRPQLSLGAVSGSGSLRPGELILVSATIQNAGGIAAENVSVALVVDGRTVDRVLLSRIPVGTSSLATLSWVSTQTGGDVQVVLDPQEEITLTSREGTISDVTFGSTLGVPGIGIGATLALAVALALAFARRRSQ